VRIRGRSRREDVYVLRRFASDASPLAARKESRFLDSVVRDEIR